MQRGEKVSTWVIAGSLLGGSCVGGDVLANDGDGTRAAYTAVKTWSGDIFGGLKDSRADSPLAKDKPSASGTPPAQPSPTSPADTPTSPTASSSAPAEYMPEQCVGDMSLERKIGNLLAVPINTNDYASNPSGSTEETAKILKKYHIGGVIITTNGIKNPETEVKPYADKLMYPDLLDIMADFEGGSGKERIDRLQTTVTATVPTQREVANTMSADQATKLLHKAYKEYVNAGFTTILGPVADVAPANGSEAGIGTFRTFSNDPSKVAAYVAAYQSAAKKAGINTVLKHLPGGGDMGHTDFVGPTWVPPKSILKKHALKPLKILKQAGPITAGIMVNSAIVKPEGDQAAETSWSEGKPSILSGQVIEDLVTDYGIQGPVYSDDIGTNAVQKWVRDDLVRPRGSEELAKVDILSETIARAIGAGVTKNLWLQNEYAPSQKLGLEAQINSIIALTKAGVEAGTIKEETINKSVLTNYRNANTNPCGAVPGGDGSPTVSSSETPHDPGSERKGLATGTLVGDSLTSGY